MRSGIGIRSRRKAGENGNGHGAATWAFHKRVYGANFPYFDFAPMFRAELFDPDHWADVFARSGANYVALTSKHHEGFTLWKSARSQSCVGTPVEQRGYRAETRPAARSH